MLVAYERDNEVNIACPVCPVTIPQAYMRNSRGSTMMTPELKKKKSSNANPTPSAKPTMRYRLIDLTV